MSVESLTKIKQEKEGSGCREAGAALPRQGPGPTRVTAETTFEWRATGLRRPVLPELVDTGERAGMWAEGAGGKVLRGLGGSQRGLYFA